MANILRKQYKTEDSTAAWEISRVARNLVAESAGTALVSFFSRAYWGRTWIIQELAAGQDWMTFACGGRTIDLESLLLVAGNIDNWKEGPLARTPRFEATMRLVKFIKPLQFAGQAAENTDLMAVTRTRLVDVEPLPSLHELNAITQLSSHASTTLPHDKIFGILGILPLTVSTEVTVDYSLSFQDVLISFTKALLKGTKDIRMIYCGSRSDKNSPSWVFDLEKPSDRAMLLEWEPASPLAFIRAGFSPDSSFYSRDDVLHVEGYKIDTIATSPMSGALSAPPDGAAADHINKSPPKPTSNPSDHGPYGRYLNSARLKESLHQNLLFGMPSPRHFHSTLFVSDPNQSEPQCIRKSHFDSTSAAVSECSLCLSG